MGLLSNTLRMGASQPSDTDDSYKIEKSLRFNSADSPFLEHYVSSSGNKDVWTWSGWVKRNKTGTAQAIFAGGEGADGHDRDGLNFLSDDTLTAYWRSGGTTQEQLITSHVFRDTSTWMHIVWAFDYDVSGTSASGKSKVYVNGRLITDWDATFSAAVTRKINATGQSFWFGKTPAGDPSDLQLADVHFIDGLALSPAAFGSFDKTLCWQPKAFELPAPSLNDGSTHSSGWAGTFTLNLGATKSFDGLLTTGSKPNNNYTITWTGDIPVKQGVRIYWECDDHSSAKYADIFVNGEPIVPTAYNGHWEVADVVNWGENNLTEIKTTQANNKATTIIAIEVDGVILVDGQTDKTYEEEKAVTYLNDGTIFLAGSAAFDGVATTDSAGNAHFTGANGNYTITFPSAITVSSSLKLQMYASISSFDTYCDVEINGSETTMSVDTSQGNQAGIYASNFTGSMTTIKVTAKGGANIGIAQVIVDGTILINERNDNVGRNSFHLKFNDTERNSSLGKDSLNGKLADATGGLPFYNTTDAYGEVKGTGDRTDSNSGNLVFAMPGTTLTDVSASPHTMTNSGVSVTTDESRFYGSSLDFNSSNSHTLHAPYSADFLNGYNGNFTIEVWVRTTATSRCIAGVWDYGNNKKCWNLYITQSGPVLICSTDGSSQTDLALAGTEFCHKGVWCHVAFVRSSNTVKCYVDGVESASTAFSGTFYDTTDAKLYVGSSNGQIEFFDGQMNDLRIYKAAKYTANFKPPARNDFAVTNFTHEPGVVKTADSTGAKPVLSTTGDFGGSTDDSANTDSNASYLLICLSGKSLTEVEPTGRTTGTRTWTAYGDAAVSTDSSRFYGSSFKFDGTGDYISSPDSTAFDMGSNSFTIEAWINPANLTHHGVIAGQWQDGGAANCAYSLQLVNGKPRLVTGENPNIYSCISDDNIVANKWTHIAGVYDGSTNTSKLYVNGVLKKTLSSHSSCNNGGPDFHLGAALHGSPGNWSRGTLFNGYIQDLRMYQGLVKYTSDFTVTSEGDFPGLDVLVESPTNYGTDTGVGGEVRGTYCTWNPLDRIDPTNVLLTEGNLKIQTPGHTTSATAYGTTRGTIGVTSGKWYFEIDDYEQHGSTGHMLIGVISTDAPLPQYCGGDGSISYTAYDGKVRVDDNGGTAYGNTFTTGDVIGVALDMDNGAIYFSINNTWQNSGSPTSGSSRTNAGATWTAGTKSYTPGISDFQEGSGRYITAHLNTGGRAFKYTAPSGFKCLCTQNLPDTFGANSNSAEDLNDPSKYFDIHKWTGNATARSFSGWKFQPDVIWMKSRSIGQSHLLYDVIRGSGKILYPDLTHESQSYTVSLQSFDSDGFTWGTDSYGNGSNGTFVFWGWDCGTAAATASTDGSVTPSAQWVNNTAGFSITEFTGTGSTITVGHGLDVAPHFIVQKNISHTANWNVYVKPLGNTKRLVLNDNSAESTGYWNSSDPTDDVVAMTADIAESSKDYIMYCWTPIEGFSSFGSYEGNGNADGPFVYTGFSPRWILFRNATITKNWSILDIERDLNNANDTVIKPDENSTEVVTVDWSADILSNGFKPRDSGNAINGNGNTIIYAAFAEHPFKTARAR